MVGSVVKTSTIVPPYLGFSTDGAVVEEVGAVLVGDAVVDFVGDALVV